MTRFSLLIALHLFLVSNTFASLPEVITYQGHVVDSQGEPLGGPFDITFRIYDRENAAAGEEIWKETQAGVPIAEGDFSVKIGSAAAQSAHPLHELAFDKPYWIGIEIASLGELAPRQTLDAVPFAYRVHDGVTLSEDQTISGNKNFTGQANFQAVASLKTAAPVGSVYVQGSSAVESLSSGMAGKVLRSKGSGQMPEWVNLGATEQELSLLSGMTQMLDAKRITYTGNAASRSITGVGFRPQLIIILAAQNGGQRFPLFKEEIMPGDWYMATNGESGFPQTNGITITDDGFNLGSNGAVNGNGTPYAAWCFRLDS